MKYQEIDWSKKNDDAVRKAYRDLLPEERYSFFKWLHAHYPAIDDDWLGTFDDLRNELSQQDNIAACEDFLSWFPQQYPKQYCEHGEFIERDLCDYYLYTKNLGALKERIKCIEQNPGAGIDVVTLKLFYQLVYHGLYEEATEYARNIIKPLEEDENVVHYPENKLIQGLYDNALQTVYEQFKSTGRIDITELRRLAEEFDLHENHKTLNAETKALQHSLDADEILYRCRANFREVYNELDVYFLKYMLDKYQVPFLLSDIFWSLIGVKGLFGKSKASEDFFYVDADVFDEELAQRIDHMFRSNILEIFGKVWGLYYVYEFLEEYHLISPEGAARMRENILYYRNQMVRYMNKDLWQMSFVFNWPAHHLWEPLSGLFESTYGQTSEQGDKIIEEVNNQNPISQRLKEELKLKAEVTNDNAINSNSQKVSRNALCPCGSGKKYKRCCMNKK